jgi:hypothetical protein
MTKEEKAVIRVAMALCKVGGGFCFKDDLTISNKRVGRRLEYACAALQSKRRRK